MKPLIKVSDAPKEWLVLDRWVPSGQVDFVSLKRNFCQSCEELMDINYVFNGCKHCNDLLVYEYFGTKHIQLVYVNVSVTEDGTVFGEDGQTGYGFVNPKVYDDIEKLPEGKDFFIYKVTEEKDVK